MKLITSTDTLRAERRIRGAFRQLYRVRYFDTVFEHGQWWVLRPTPNGDPETYSAHDAEGCCTDSGIGFERIA